MLPSSFGARFRPGPNGPHEGPWAPPRRRAPRGSVRSGSACPVRRRRPPWRAPSRRCPGGLGPVLGRVAHAVLHHADCPVLIVPRESARGEEER
ncbi:universal stress protein [Streptomyces zhihengii]|uniref:universal stress protein n=1 Tax=Streptomyces zhihengii TaxID=1818004 RepID=UPI0036393BC1